MEDTIMRSHTFARFVSRAVDRISISPRLIVLLFLYVIVVLFLVYALLSAPLLVIGLSLLAGLAVDKRVWIKRRFKTWKGNRQHS